MQPKNALLAPKTAAQTLFLASAKNTNRDRHQNKLLLNINQHQMFRLRITVRSVPPSQFVIDAMIHLPMLVMIARLSKRIATQRLILVQMTITSLQTSQMRT